MQKLENIKVIKILYQWVCKMPQADHFSLSYLIQLTAIMCVYIVNTSGMVAQTIIEDS